MENNNNTYYGENSERNNNENIEKNEYIQGDTFVMRSSETAADSQYKGESYTMGENNSTSTNNSYSEVKSDFQPNMRYDSSDSENKSKKKSGLSGKRILSYILVGLFCTTLGGIASGFATLFLLPKTEFFKDTALYQAVAEVMNKSGAIYDLHPTSVAVEKDALTVADIVRKVGPAVVGVSTKSRGTSGIFGNQGVQQGIGSGMIINEEGYVLTNYHVVQGAQQVSVILSNGKEVAAKVVNFDQNYDVAVVQITEKIQVPAVAELGDSRSLQVGESVVAIGNPLGKEFLGSVTSGIVSAVNRNIDNDKNGIKYIQTDAAINSGNSGGPLINSRGQVIGINTAKIGATGVEGLGFAIPIDEIKDKIKELSRPILKVGISAREVTEELSKQYKIPTGVYILEVQEFSPAEKAGIQPGDIIVKFAGETVKTVNDINKIKNKYKSGDVVKVEISRDNKTITKDLKLSE